MTPETLRAKVAALNLSAHDAMTPEDAPHDAPRACPTCGGAGWIRVAQIGSDSQWQSRLEPCADRAHDQERWQRARRLSDISDKLLALDFAGYDASDNPHALAATQAWATDAGRAAHPWLFLFGGTGTGKTHLMAAAFNAMTASGRYPLYTLTPDLLQHVKDALDENPKEYGPRFTAVQHAPILILDDLGAERRTPWSEEMLFRLIDYRYRQELPTAVASNLLPDELEDRIASRLQDTALGAVILMRGADRRKTNERKPTSQSQRKGGR